MRYPFPVKRALTGNGAMQMLELPLGIARRVIHCCPHLLPKTKAVPPLLINSTPVFVYTLCTKENILLAFGGAGEENFNKYHI